MNNDFSYNKIFKVLENLNSILQLIEEIEKLLKTEIFNENLELYYKRDLIIHDININGMSFTRINSLINYIKKGSSHSEYLKLDKMNDLIEEWFCNHLLETCCFFKEPISFSLSSKLNKLIFEIEEFNEDNYFLSNVIIFSTEQLDILKRKVINKIYNYNLIIRELEKRNKKIKADSDYIKKDKK